MSTRGASAFVPGWNDGTRTAQHEDGSWRWIFERNHAVMGEKHTSSPWPQRSGHGIARYVDQ
eukprot:12881492-Prorocentrum_lima.AAC.1